MEKISKQESVLEKVLNELCSEIGSLKTKMDNLDAKLEPVMSAPYPINEKVDEGEEKSSEVVGRLRMFRNRINMIGKQVETIFNRLDV